MDLKCEFIHQRGIHIQTQLYSCTGIYPKKTGGPWKEVPFDFLITRSHTIPNLLSGAAGAHIWSQDNCFSNRCLNQRLVLSYWNQPLPDSNSRVGKPVQWVQSGVKSFKVHMKQCQVEGQDYSPKASFWALQNFTRTNENKVIWGYQNKPKIY